MNLLSQRFRHLLCSEDGDLCGIVFTVKLLHYNYNYVFRSVINPHKNSRVENAYHSSQYHASI